MSQQQRADDVIGLEEIFRSGEFGRRTTRRDATPVPTVDPIEPAHLEQVFRSELFGHPDAIRTPSSLGVPASEPALTGPTLVLLSGRGDAERVFTRSRAATGAVSGVAAAALVVAGMTTGTGSPSGPPTVSAEGKHPGHGASAGAGNSVSGPGGVETQPNGAGSTSGEPPVATGGSGSGTQVARLAAAATPAAAAVVVEVPPATAVEVAPSPPPPPPGGGTTPSAPSPAGGGNVLTPVFVAVGSTVATVGSTVTAAADDLAQTVPTTSPVSGLLSGVGATVTSLGRSVAGV